MILFIRMCTIVTKPGPTWSYLLLVTVAVSSNVEGFCNLEPNLMTILRLFSFRLFVVLPRTCIRLVKISRLGKHVTLMFLVPWNFVQILCANRNANNYIARWTFHNLIATHSYTYNGFFHATWFVISFVNGKISATPTYRFKLIVQSYTFYLEQFGFEYYLLGSKCGVVCNISTRCMVRWDIRFREIFQKHCMKHVEKNYRAF